MNKLAIAAGTIADVTGSLVTMFAVIIATGFVEGARGRIPDEKTMEGWFQEPIVLLIMMGIGLFWLVAGGFITGKIAGRDHVRHAAWTGVMALVISLVFLALPSGGGPAMAWWYNAFSLLVTIPTSMAGGYLAKPRAS